MTSEVGGFPSSTDEGRIETTVKETNHEQELVSPHLPMRGGLKLELGLIFGMVHCFPSSTDEGRIETNLAIPFAVGRGSFPSSTDEGRIET